jgi:hypothetical protein
LSGRLKELSIRDKLDKANGYDADAIEQKCIPHFRRKVRRHVGVSRVWDGNSHKILGVRKT